MQTNRALFESRFSTANFASKNNLLKNPTKTDMCNYSVSRINTIWIDSLVLSWCEIEYIR